MLLELSSLGVTYGGVRAVDGVSMTLEAGRLVGLIGPNGAGKTTLIDAVTGFTPYDGTVCLADRPLEGLGPHRRARAGLARTFQSVELFDDLDVAGNLLVAATPSPWWAPLADAVRPGRRSGRGGIDGAVELLGIGHLVDRRPGDLSDGERKLVGVGRALATGPQVLLLDEPAAGLDTSESVVLGERLRRIVDTGVAVLLVDHDMELVLGVCDEVHVIERGRLIASGPPSAVRDDEQVVAAYLGHGVR